MGIEKLTQKFHKQNRNDSNGGIRLQVEDSSNKIIGT